MRKDAQPAVHVWIVDKMGQIESEYTSLIGLHIDITVMITYSILYIRLLQFNRIAACINNTLL